MLIRRSVRELRLSGEGNDSSSSLMSRARGRARAEEVGSSVSVGGGEAWLRPRLEKR